MKIVRVEGNVVVEIIPKEATPVSKWYNQSFAKQCVEAPDEVQNNWYYDPSNNTFRDSFNEGDIVNFDGKLYKSLVDGNKCSPETYPAGWELYSV